MAKNSKKIDVNRRKFLLAATSVTGAVGVCALGVPFVASMGPSEKAKAAGAPVEFDVAQVKKDELKTAEWRGQPVWILNRSEKMLSSLNDIEILTDPDSKSPQQPTNCQNETRSIKPNLLVMVGICTHLGCSPTPKLKNGVIWVIIGRADFSVHAMDQNLILQEGFIRDHQHLPIL